VAIRLKKEKTITKLVRKFKHLKTSKFPKGKRNHASKWKKKTDLNNHKPITTGRKSRGWLIGLVCFLVCTMIGNVMINFVGSYVDIFMMYGLGEIFNPNVPISRVRFSWFWLFRFRWLWALILNVTIAFWLAFVTYKNVGRRFDTLAHGQKGKMRFKTQAEIRQIYQAIPYRETEFEGIGGMPVSYEDKTHYIDTAAVNSLIVGATRSGKGEMFIVPKIDNLSRAKIKTSIVAHDPKGELFAASIAILEKRGYEVQILNLKDPLQSMSYNPLYLAAENWRNNNRQEAKRLITTFSHAMFHKEDAGQNAWVYSGAKNIFSAVAMALIDECYQNDELEKVTVYNVAQMIIELSSKTVVNKATNEKKDGLDIYFSKLPAGNEAKALYAAASSAADKQKGTIVSTVHDHLALFQMESIAKMTSTNSFDLKSVGFPKWVTVKFNKSLANKRFKAHFKRNGVVLDTYGIKTNAEGIATLNFDVEIKDHDELEIVRDMRFIRKATPKQKVVYRLKRTVSKETKGYNVMNEVAYSKVVQLHKTVDSIKQISDIEMKYSDKPLAIFIVTPDYDTSRSAIATTFIKQLYTELAMNADNTRGKMCFTRVNFIIDEAGNMPAIEDLGQAMTVCLGRNILFDLYFQDYSQIDSLYNEKIAKTIKGNSQHIYIASADPDTHEQVSKRADTTTVESISRSQKPLELETSETRQAVDQRILLASEVSTLKEGEVIVFPIFKRRDLKGNKIHAYPIYNKDSNGNAMPFRYEFIPEFDTKNDINEIDIPSCHENLCLMQNAVDFERMFSNSTKVKTEKKNVTLYDLNDKLVRAYLAKKKGWGEKILDEIMKKDKVG